jgi:dTDP-4-dehydrorhamnose 3,5-epimerase-like enzyme
MKKSYLLKDVVLIPIFRLDDKRGLMTVVSSSVIPFEIKRIFSISSKNMYRGNHAHKDCAQFIVCLSGFLDVFVDDGFVQQKYTLNQFSEGLIIPPGIWSYQKYSDVQTIINVYCDMDYKESDYIRNYEVYINYRKKLKLNNI